MENPNEKPFILRSYAPSDIEGILRVFESAISLLCANDYSPSQKKAWLACADKERWKKEFASRHTTVAEADGKITGFCDCEANGHIDRLYVAAEYAHRGIGSALVKDAENSHDNTVSFVEASVIARPFFEKLGYVATEKRQVFRNGEYLTNYKMRKNIRRAL